MGTIALMRSVIVYSPFVGCSSGVGTGKTHSSLKFARCTFRSGSCSRQRLHMHSRQSCRLGKQRIMTSQATRNPLEEELARGDNINVNLRSEAEAPWRTLRLVMFSFFCVSATVGAVIATVQVVSALRGSDGALPLNDVATSLAVDLGAVGTFAFLLRRDLKARDKQVARLQREERLGALQIELASGKLLRLTKLRGFARVVLFAGTPEQVRQVVEAAESYRQDLIDRTVLLVALPIYGDSLSDASGVCPLEKDDLKFRAMPVRLEEWSAWFGQQLSASSKSAEQGLYVSLRLDGRVRGSGTGAPPFDRFVKQMAVNTDGSLWKGFLDGMDGRVN
mmetsp:Transcript_13748/g.41523  ORF Transcript_13748/g.41523 Transcript_13748/m.41523 type:complete len:335 (+) Transcript_13748:106-1110(+)